MSQADAKAYCESLDEKAQLAEIKTQDIQEFVEGLEDLESHAFWWLGGNDKAQVLNIHQ